MARWQDSFKRVIVTRRARTAGFEPIPRRTPPSRLAGCTPVTHEAVKSAALYTAGAYGEVLDRYAGRATSPGDLNNLGLAYAQLRVWASAESALAAALEKSPGKRLRKIIQRNLDQVRSAH